MTGMLIPGAGVPGAAQGADLSNDAGYGYEVPPGDTLSVQRVISSYSPPEDTLDVRRIIGRLTPPEDTLDIHRTIYWRSITPPEDTLSVQRKVITFTPPGDTLSVRRTVVSEADAPYQRWSVYLDGENITAATDMVISINATEGQNRTATFRFLPEVGQLDIPSLQGRDVQISRYIDGNLVDLFTGSLDRPVYDFDSRQMVCNCSDLREERLGSESQTLIKQMTGGVYSKIVQQEDAEGREWVTEFMKTVPGTPNYDGSGVLHYAPWAIGTPRYTLNNQNVRRDELSFPIAERSQIINKTTIKIDYRYNRQRVRTQRVVADAGYTNVQNAPSGTTLTTKSAYLQALQGLSNWTLLDYDFTELDNLASGAGLYYNSIRRSTTYVGGVRTTTQFNANDIYAVGVGANIARHISQPVVETYTLTITAPESIDQYGVVEGSSQQHAVETDVDGDAFEEQVPTSSAPDGFSLSASGDYIRYADDKRAVLQLAAQAAWLISLKEILERHRKTEVNYVHHDQPGDSILDLRIGDTITLNTQVVECTGNVKGFEHRQDADGMADTRVTLAISSVSSEVVTSNNFSQPAPPTIPEQSRRVAPVVYGTVDNGAVEITAPEIQEAYVDEVTATKSATFTVQIPRDPFVLYRTEFHE